MWKRKFSKVLLIFFLLGVATQLVLGDDGPTIDDYCEKDAEKLPCSTKCALGSDCGDVTDNEWEEMPQAFRDDLLKEHNTMRNRVAKGELAPAGGGAATTAAPAAPDGRRRRDDDPPPAEPAAPGAAAPAGPAAKEIPKQFPSSNNMQVLSYSKELEFLALCHARACKDEGAGAIMSDGTEVGMNVYVMEGDAVGEEGEAVTEPADFGKKTVDEWMDQAAALTAPLGAYAASTESTLGHMTQLLWGSTKKVGCGKVHFVADDKNKWLVACAYFPKGNEDGTNVYEVGGETCKDKNAEYEALCGEIEDMEEFTFPALGGALKVAAAWSTITYFVWYFVLAHF